MQPVAPHPKPSLGQIRHLHLVGIGGSGMAGIAEVLLSQGYKISGSDVKASPVTNRLQALGADIFYGHSADNILGSHAIVVSTAITQDNVEVSAARRAGIPVVRRAEMLAELMRFHYGIAVAGTHGKTTTTSLVASLLTGGGLDPTYVIGGLLNSAGSNAKMGQSHYFVAEADESDASFLYLKPMLAIMTNIDSDHLATYDNDFEKLKATFLAFLHHLPFYGLAIVCVDNPVVRELLPQIQRPVLTYGVSEEADLRAINITQAGVHNSFQVIGPANPKPVNFSVNLPGQHNVLNALAAIAVARVVQLDDHVIANSLQQFAGVGRRFQVYGEQACRGGQYLLIDDYGHHPQEIAATLQAARAAWPTRRLVIAFQPHRYSRTRDLFPEFVDVLSQADVVCLLDIYAASEAPIPGVSSQALVEAMAKQTDTPCCYTPTESALRQQLGQTLQNHDVLITLGAGNVGTMAANLSSQALAITA